MRIEFLIFHMKLLEEWKKGFSPQKDQISFPLSLLQQNPPLLKDQDAVRPFHISILRLDNYERKDVIG